MSYGGAGGAIVTDFALADLQLSGIPFMPGRTVEATMPVGVGQINGCRLVQIGKSCLLSVSFNVRFGEAGATNVMWIGLPVSIPIITGPSDGFDFLGLTAQPGIDICQLNLEPISFFSGVRNYMRMSRFTPAFAASNWPINPAARAAVVGQVSFTI